jgi:hypothetical protein
VLTPAPASPHERGQRWLQAKTEQILADNAIALAHPHAEGAPSCYWGTGPETRTTLYFLLDDDPELKALFFRRTMITDCGAGLYSSQHNATLFIRRMLRKMGLLSA